jgi:acyl dehydratase
MGADVAIKYPDILQLREDGHRFVYGDREAMLYAVGIGMEPAIDPERQFVYERDLQAMPTLATVIAGGAGVSIERMGVDYSQVVHGEEETILHRPVPARGSVVTRARIVGVEDKGSGRGALVLSELELMDEQSRELIATLRRTTFARGDGGFGGPSARLSAPGALPERQPDAQLDIATHANQAAIYRLCGDRNPLHIDPEHARQVGFERPILHGLCTYGIATRALLRVYCGYDASRLHRIAARFSSPVFPGETLSFRFWKDADQVQFDAQVRMRQATVLTHGRATIGGSRLPV